MTGSALAERLSALTMAVAVIALIFCTLGLAPLTTPGGSAAIGSAGSISPSLVESSDPCDRGEHAECDPLGHTTSISTTSSTPQADLALVQVAAGAATTARAPTQMASAPPSLIGLSVLRL